MNLWCKVGVSEIHGVGIIALKYIPMGTIITSVPEKYEIPRQEIEPVIDRASKSAATQNITGKDLTPFLLGDILDKTSGRSLETNQALAINNIKLGVDIAKKLAKSREVLA